MNHEGADFVVVGAGSAGCIVATRLAEAGFTTVLLEAGGRDRNPLIHIPAGVRYLHGKRAAAWLEVAETGPEAGGRVIAWPRGRVLGGSGSINGMIFLRGAASDFDRWAQLGCTGWDWESVLPAFRSLERWRGAPAPHRGADGPLPVEESRFSLPITDSFVAAAEAAGLVRRQDLNAGELDGVGYTQMNRFGRFRGSSARAFLGRGRRTGRLTVLTGAHAERLIFDGTSCIGVTFRYRGKARQVSARRETILCAGTIGSPKLLMLSGLGEAAGLAEFGIPTVRDLPAVGQNLQDHYAARLSFRLKGTTTINELAHPPRLWWEAVRWAWDGRSALSTGISAATLFCRSHPDLAAPDTQLLFSPSSFDRDRYGALERLPGALITVAASRPSSRGRVRLASADPDAPPVISANYLADPYDLRVIIAGIATARAIMTHPPIAGHVVTETLPGSACNGAELEAFVREQGGSVYHPVGTCRMGADPDSVVDPDLRVRGVARLRVIDASIMPLITSANTNAPTMMIAEHGTGRVIAEHRAVP